ncbi:hypothetical protein BDW66DRAFT_151410 [Aspergillus desertorum]
MQAQTKVFGTLPVSKGKAFIFTHSGGLDQGPKFFSPAPKPMPDLELIEHDIEPKNVVNLMLRFNSAKSAGSNGKFGKLTVLAVGVFDVNISAVHKAMSSATI